jgi:methylmalonyl-CoA mutase N-terminal domain/subunit
VAAIEAGWVQGEIEAAANRWSAAVESGERTIVGVNEFIDEADDRIELHRLDPEAVRRQLERTRRLRAERNADEAAQALERVGAAARATENMLPPLREALRARCTVGEACTVLREEWGVHDRPAR